MENSEFAKQLESVVGDGNVTVDEPMSAHTTFRIGGPADFFVEPASAEAVMRVVSLCREQGRALYILGRGSNLLVADAGLRGVVVHLGSALSHVEVREDGTVTAQAGALNSSIARSVQAAGLEGFEFAAGIPGSIGGAAIMNAGAYGGELRDIATGVSCIDENGTPVNLAAEDAEWGYRRSRMGDEGLIVLSVQMQLREGSPEAIRDRMMELAKRRGEKQPLDLPSAGSTFKRPKGHYAGKLIQEAGMQGHRVGGAEVSTKHAGFVVNLGDATAADVLQVIEDVKRIVLERSGVALEPEVRLWGFES